MAEKRDKMEAKTKLNRIDVSSVILELMNLGTVHVEVPQDNPYRPIQMPELLTKVSFKHECNINSVRSFKYAICNVVQSIKLIFRIKCFFIVNSG
jgi:hypothetical protein